MKKALILLFLIYNYTLANFSTNSSGTLSNGSSLHYNLNYTSGLYYGDISLVNKNFIPSIDINTSIQLDEDSKYTLAYSSNNTNGGNITPTISSNASNGTVLINDYNITYTPNENYNGVDSFTLSFDMGDGNITEKNISINIASINDTPKVKINYNKTIQNIQTYQLDVNENYIYSYNHIYKKIEIFDKDFNLISSFLPSFLPYVYKGKGLYSSYLDDNIRIMDKYYTHVYDINGTFIESLGKEYSGNLYGNIFDRQTNKYSIYENHLWGIRSRIFENGVELSQSTSSGTPKVMYDNKLYSTAGVYDSNFTLLKDLSGFDEILLTHDKDNNIYTSKDNTIKIYDENFSFIEEFNSTNTDFVTYDGKTFYFLNDSDNTNVKNIELFSKNLYLTVNKNSIYEFTEKNFTDKFFDVDDDLLSKIKIISLPNNGELYLNEKLVSINDEIIKDSLSNLSYRAEQDFSGLDNFGILINDGVNYADENLTIKIKVNNIPDTNISAIYTTNEDTNLDINYTSNDEDNDSIIVSIETQASNGMVYINENQLVYTPNLNYNGTDNFTIKFDDESGGIVLRTININISSVNDVPIISNEIFTENLNIISNSNSANDFHVSDVDHDGDMDILLAYSNNIAWYENDGSENFIFHNISDQLDYAVSVYSIDIDNDSDIDVLSASRNDDKIVLYENNGTQGFTSHIISTQADYASSVFSIDVDQDGDMDILSASIYDHKIAWYENDGSKNFTSHTITTEALGANDVYAIDIDQDGDIDILSASAWDDKIIWYENNGTQGFTSYVITDEADNIQNVYSIDVDQDGDMDILSASEYDDKIAWYENNGSQNFTTHSIEDEADRARSIYPIDIDFDGDIDILSAYADYVVWFENDGNQNFTSSMISSEVEFPKKVYSIDIDKDGDMDVLIGSNNGITLYYNNLFKTINENISTISGVISFEDNDSDIFTYSISGIDSNVFNINENNGTISFKNSPDFENPLDNNLDNIYELNITVADDGNLSDSKQIKIKVLNLENEEPSISIDTNTTIDEGNSNTFVFSILDDDNDSVIVSIDSNASNGTLILNDSNITYTPNENYYGTDNFVVKFDDGNGGMVLKTIRVNVENINDTPNIPTIFTDIVLLEDNGTTSYDLNISDIDGDDLNLTIESNNTSLISVSKAWSNNLVQGDYNGIPLDFNLTTAENANGVAKITFTLRDANSSTSKSFYVNVTAVNDAPILATISDIKKAENFEDFNITLSASDIDNSDLIYNAKSNDTSKVTVSINSNILTISSIANANGVVSIDVNVSDGNLSNSKSFDINIVEDTPPIFQTIEDITKLEDSSEFNISLSANDIDGDSITYTSTSSDPSKATVSISNGNLIVTPVNNSNGLITIEVNATANTQSVTQSFELHLTPQNDTPIWNNTLSDVITNEDSDPLTLTIDAIDIDGDTLTYSVTSSNSSLVNVSSPNSNGEFVISYLPNKYGNVSITTTTSDGIENISQTFDINISAVNDLPTIQKINDKNWVENFGSLDINISFIDVDGDTINVNTLDTNISNENIATISDNNDKTITISSLTDVNGSAVIYIRAIVTDGTSTIELRDSFNIIIKNSTTKIKGTNPQTTKVVDNMKITNVTYENKVLELSEEGDTGKTSISLELNNGMKTVLNSNIAGTNTEIDENGSVVTTLSSNDYNSSIKIQDNGTQMISMKKSDIQLDLENKFNGETNTTITDIGTIETRLETNSSKIQISIDTNGTSTSEIEIGSKKTEIRSSNIENTTTVDSSGNIKSVIQMSEPIELEISSSDGKIKPNIKNLIMPESFPSGTQANVDNNFTIEFNLQLNSNKLTF